MPHLEIVSRVAGVAVRQGTRNPGQSDAYLNTAGDHVDQDILSCSPLPDHTTHCKR